MSASRTIENLRSERTALSKALLIAVGELEQGRPSTMQKRRAVVASILSDPVVETALVHELRESGAVSKSTSRFSALAEGLRNYSSFGVTDGEVTKSGGLPSTIAKRRAQGGKS
jgi:hypothetical protein